MNMYSVEVIELQRRKDSSALCVVNYSRPHQACGSVADAEMYKNGLE